MSETPEKRLWEYVAFSDRKRPEEPASDKLRTALRSLWKQFRPWSRHEPSQWKGDLDAPPRALLDEVVPNPDFTEGAEALSRALDRRLERDDDSLLVLFEAGGVTREAFALVAEERGWPRIEPPARDALLDGAKDWAPELPDETSAPVVLPALELCYLRHHRGLALVRRLLERISRGDGRWLVGCDSWAWAYLSQALHAEAVFPAPLVLQGFDGDRLCAWLAELASGTGRSFRDSASGAPLLHADGGNDRGSTTDREDERHAFFATLAGRSRGVPGIARAIWRHSLSVEVSEEARQKAEEESPDELRQTLWVTPWSKLSLPGVPAESPQSVTFVLQALLVHGGLDEATLEVLLPSTGEPLSAALQRLRRARLVTREEGLLRVDPLAYPAVSRHVAHHFGLGDGL